MTDNGGGAGGNAGQEASGNDVEDSASDKTV